MMTMSLFMSLSSLLDLPLALTEFNMILVSWLGGQKENRKYTLCSRRDR
jgi:hypothetical protein